MLLVLDTSAVINLLQKPRQLQIVVARCREDFPEASILISTLKLKIGRWES